MEKSKEEIAHSPELVKQFADKGTEAANNASNVIVNVTPKVEASRKDLRSLASKLISSDSGSLASITKEELTAIKSKVDFPEVNNAKETLNAYKGKAEEVAGAGVGETVKNDLTKAQQTITDQQKKLSQTISEATRVERLRAKLELYAADIEKLAKLNADLARLPKNPDSLLNILDEQIPKPVTPVVFEVATPLDLTYNLIEHTYFGQIRLPQGFNYDTAKLKKDLEGKPSTPNVDLAKCIADAAGKVDFTYTSHRQDALNGYLENHPGNLYFASERWTEWACPNTAATSGLKIIFSGGEKAREVGEDIWNHVDAEFADLKAWGKLQAMDPKQWAQFATQIVEDINEVVAKRSIAGVSSPIDIVGGPVDVKYTMRPTGTTEFSKIVVESVVQELEKEMKGKKLEYEQPHWGFALVYRLKGNAVATPETLVARYKKLRPSGNFWNYSSKQDADRAFFDAFDKVLGPVKGAKLRSAYASISGGGLAQKLEQIFKIDEEYLENRALKGDFVVDFTNKPIAADLSNFAKKFAFTPNQGTAKTERLTFDLRTGRIEANITLTHRYQWRGVKQAIRDLEEAARQRQAGDGLLKPDAARLVTEQFIGQLSPQAKEMVESLQKANAIKKEIAELETKLAPLKKELQKLKI